MSLLHGLKKSVAYRRCRAALLLRLRKSGTVRRIVRAARIGRSVRLDGVTPLIFTSGRAVPDHAIGTGVNVLIVALEFSSEQAEALLRRVEEAQLTFSGIRPVILTSGEGLRAARRYGYAVEVLQRCKDWEDPNSWRLYILRHIARMRSMYGIAHVIDLTRAPGGTEHALLGLAALNPK